MQYAVFSGWPSSKLKQNAEWKIGKSKNRTRHYCGIRWIDPDDPVDRDAHADDMRRAGERRLGGRLIAGLESEGFVAGIVGPHHRGIGSERSFGILSTTAQALVSNLRS